jgi:hypothetical protein
MRYWWVPFIAPLPTLDLRLVNNTSKTVFINRITFTVTESRPVLEPILLIQADRLGDWVGRFSFLNEGWGEVRNATIRFRLLKSPGELNPDVKVEPPYPYVQRLGTFEEAMQVDLTEELEREGVRWEALRGLVWQSWTGSGPTATIEVERPDGKIVEMSGRQYERRRAEACGPFRNGVADVAGEISYSWNDGTRTWRKTLPFFTTVVLYPRGRKGKPKPPSASYSVMLLVEGKDYVRAVPVSHVIEPGKAERILMHVGVARSSEHRFVVDLELSSGVPIRSREISLEVALPCRMTRFLPWTREAGET